MIAVPSYKTPYYNTPLDSNPINAFACVSFSFSRQRHHVMVELFPFMMIITYIAWFVRFIVNRVSYALCDRRCLFKYLVFVLIYNIVNSNNLSFTMHGNMKILI